MIIVCQKLEVSRTQCKFPFYACSKKEETIYKSIDSNCTINDNDFLLIKEDAVNVIDKCQKIQSLVYKSEINNKKYTA